MLFDCSKSLVDFGAKLPLNPLTPAQTVAVFTAVGAPVFAHQGAGLFRDATHLARALAPHIQNWPYMQRTHRCVRIPGAPGPVAFEYFRELVCVLREMLQRYRAVFNKAHRFAIALEAHHDVQASFAYIPQFFLRQFIAQFDHAPRQAEVSHQRRQLAQLELQFVLVRASKLDQQNSLWRADQGLPDGGSEGRVFQRQGKHGAVHQFDCSQASFAELDDVLGGLHGPVKTREIHHPQNPGAG